MTYAEIVALGRPVAILFTSSTCGPCKRLKPRVQEMSEMLEFELHVLDIAKEMDAVRALGIRGVPSMVAAGGNAGEPELLFTGDLPSPSIALKLHQAGVIRD